MLYEFSVRRKEIMERKEQIETNHPILFRLANCTMKEKSAFIVLDHLLFFMLLVSIYLHFRLYVEQHETDHRY